jgi:hypothetical protein
MKRSIFIALFASFLSLSAINTFCNKEMYELNVTQIGGAAIAYGVKSESDFVTGLGTGIASFGGGALINAWGLSAGASWAIAGIIATPAGWVTLGVAAIL